MFLILFYLVVLLHDNLVPELINFTITIEGVKVSKNFYYFRDFDHFYIIYEDDGVKNLYLQFKNPFRGRVIVPIEGQDAIAIRKFLLKYIKEDLEREAEPLSERLRRWLKL
jgi:hypothetical protein